MNSDKPNVRSPRNKSPSLVVIDGYPVKYRRWVDGEFGFDEPSIRALRLFLIEKYGICYFCKRTVKDYTHKQGEPKQPDLGTIDHLKPRPVLGIKGRHKYEVVQKVLACFQCNHDRNVSHIRNKKK